MTNRQSTLSMTILALGALSLAACGGDGAAPQAAATGGAAPAQTTELRDFGVAPTTSLRLMNYHANTPRTVPGARTITTAELAALLREPRPPVLLDVLNGRGHATVAGATWLPAAGTGSSFDDDVQTRLVAATTTLTGGDKARTVVVFCLSEMCWLSYNAALRLVRAGFTDVRWYRGGTEAWAAASLPTARATAGTW